MTAIAHIESPFETKFGIPRQSGLVPSVHSRIVFEKEFRRAEAVRGLEGFTHIWLLWQFSEAKGWSPTVRPPMLGGNTRVGVFATRSPYRPNHIGLSCVRLVKVDMEDKDAPVLYVEGADLMNGTPIIDIKPYLPYTDAHPEAKGGFAEQAMEDSEALEVILPHDMPQMPDDVRRTLCEVLTADPRPRYQHDPQRVYGMTFSGYEVRFSVQDARLTVLSCLRVE